jgi:hypothetical protein
MIRLAAAVTAGVVIACAAPVFAQNGGSPAAFGGRIGIDERLDAADTAVAALDRARASATDLAVFVRLDIERSDLHTAVTGQWTALDARIDGYRRRSMPVLLAIGARGAAADPAWATTVHALAAHLRGRVAAYEIDAGTGASRASPRDYAFDLKLAAVQIRATDPDALVAQTPVSPDDGAWLTAVYEEGVAPYVDVAPMTAAPPALATSPSTAAAGTIEDLVARNDPSALRLSTGVPLDADPARATEQLITTVLARAGEANVAGTTFRGSVAALASALLAAQSIKAVMAPGLQRIDDAAASLTMTSNGRSVLADVPHRLLYDVASGATYLVYWDAAAPGGGVQISLSDDTGRTPVLRRTGDLQPQRLTGFTWNPVTKVAALTAPIAPLPAVLDFSTGGPAPFVSRSDVSASADLDVAEIVARNQQAQAAQANAFRTYIASLRMELHFRPSATQVFDVVSENRLFFSPDSLEWQELSFSVNNTHWGPDHPGVPLLQAEKVLTLPLDLRLTADYRYRLDGTDTVDGRPCFVVAFDPVDGTASRYRGRVWIDAATFLRVKVQTVQTRLEGLIVSNEDTTTYAPASGAAGPAAWLPSRVSTKQILLIAGRNLLIEKEQWFSGYHLDPPDFAAAREQARQSDAVMFRDTNQGVRYLVKRGTERVVSDRVRNSSKALAIGTTIDPAYAFPLPVVGLDYLNFDVKGTGMQMALLWGGVFVLGNLQVPKLGRTPFDASVDFYGIGVPGTDVRFDSQGERVGERVMTVPASTGLNLGYQMTPYQKLSASYSLRYDAYFHAPDTASDFVLPKSTTTNGIGAGYEYSRDGYQLSASAATFVRGRWAAWGPAGDEAPSQRTYRRESVGVAKDLLFGPFQSAHVSAAWYGGARMDRFSMYQFGLFDELHMHGVPSAGIRFPELVLVRGAYSFNIFDLYRLDLFLDHAEGRDPNDARIWRPVTGTGVAVTLKTPHRTMLSIDVGKSFIPDLYRGTGSFVLQVMLLRPL